MVRAVVLIALVGLAGCDGRFGVRSRTNSRGDAFRERPDASRPPGIDAWTSRPADAWSPPTTPDAWMMGPTGETGRVVGMVAAHNRVRAEAPMASPPLPQVTWDPEIAANAQRWSDRLASSGCNLMHSSSSDRPGLGENLYMTSGSATPDSVVNAWASEIRCWSAGQPVNGCSCTCGHYTQIVWRDSIRIGCAVAMCSRGEVWTCQYGPAGNFIGRAPY